MSDENSVVVAPSMRNYKVLVDQSPLPEAPEEDLPTPVISRSSSPLTDPILSSHNKLVAVESRDGSDLLATSNTTSENAVVEESQPVSEVITAAPTPYPTSVIPDQQPSEEYICHVCRRRLASAEMLKKHEELSQLHEKNLKLLKIANQKKRTDLRSDVIRLRHVVDMPDGAELRPELISSEQELGRTQQDIEQRARTLLSQTSNFVFPNGFSLSLSGASWTGNKQTNEDRMVTGFELCGGKFKGCFIADGHCGDHCADYLVSNLLVNVEDEIDASEPDLSASLSNAIIKGFQKTDSEYIQQAIENQIPSGSTLILLIFFQKNDTEISCISAHVGDSRAIMRKASGDVVRLTQDHKPDRSDEQERLTKSGGHVVDVGGVWRVFTPNVVSVGGRTLQWGLAVSRAFGDLALKRPAEIVSAVPELSTVQTVEKDSVFVVACDGIFDVLSDTETTEAAIADLADGPLAVIRTAYGKLSDDNLTVIVVQVGKKLVGEKRELDSEEVENGGGGKKVRLSYLPSELPTESAPAINQADIPSTKILTNSQFI